MKSETPRIIAHRGASGDAPENTLAAFSEAWNQGADAIECDVQCSEDGVVVVMHDTNGLRTLGDARRVDSISFEALSAMDAGSWKGAQWHHARVPDLRSVMATVPQGKEIVVELKGGVNLAPSVAAVIREFPAVDVTLIAFDFALISLAKQLTPERRALWLFGDLGSSIIRGRALGRELLKRLVDGGLDGIDLGCDANLTPELTEPIREADKRVYAFTINQRPQLMTCLSAKVDAVTTDFPRTVRRMLGGQADGSR